jgi:two-component system, OmpR family, alkaline phosphatase synthesis response regulator PhoP
MTMNKAKILAVDDEEDILHVVQYNLAKDGYQVVCADSGEKALAEINASQPDLIILDLMLPGVDGFDVCRRIKNTADTAHIPIIMLTAKTEDADIVAGLELGADDYIIKPFSPRVLVSRVKAVLRRKNAPISDDKILRFEKMVIDLTQHVVLVENQSVELTATEFRILHTLARRPGWVYSRDQIVDAVKSTNTDVTGRSVDVHIVSLRRKLLSCADCLETVRGVGYRFRDRYA